MLLACGGPYPCPLWRRVGIAHSRLKSRCSAGDIAFAFNIGGLVNVESNGTWVLAGHFCSEDELVTLTYLRRLATCALLGVLQPHPAPAATPMADAEVHRMLVTRVDTQKLATGIVVGIVQSSGKRIVSYGVLGQDDKRPVDGDTEFGIGSVTKVFTALLVSEMATRGQLSLGDPVSKYLPSDRVIVPEYAGKPITLADLATHTSGLPLRPTNLVSGWAEQGEMGKMLLTQFKEYEGYTLDDFYKFLSSYRLQYAPGAHYEYSNINYGLLGLALSNRAGKPYRDLVRQVITRPLAMHDTRMELSPGMRERLAKGYISYYGQLIPVPAEPSGPLDAAGAYYSTANDLMRFLSAVLGFDDSALKHAMDAMPKTLRPGGMPAADATTGVSKIALAWNVYDDGDDEIIWKNGSVSGYRAFIGYDAKRRVGVVALANAQSGMGVDDIGLHILDRRVPVDMSVPKFYKEVPVSAGTLDEYVGTYRYSPTDTITITRQGDHLYLTAPGQPKMEMYAYDAHDFFLKVADAQASFDGVKNGRATKIVWHQGGKDSTGERAE